MFIEILIWYIIGVIISYVIIGLVSLKKPYFFENSLVYLLSWILVFAMIIFLFAIIIMKISDKLEPIKWLNPGYTFNYLKDKYYASKK